MFLISFIFQVNYCRESQDIVQLTFSQCMLKTISKFKSLFIRIMVEGVEKPSYFEQLNQSYQFSEWHGDKQCFEYASIDWVKTCFCANYSNRSFGNLLPSISKYLIYDLWYTKYCYTKYIWETFLAFSVSLFNWFLAYLNDWRNINWKQIQGNKFLI